MAPTTNVVFDKPTFVHNVDGSKHSPRKGIDERQLDPNECNVGQLINGNSRKGKSTSQQYMKNGKRCSSRPSAQLGDWIFPVTHNRRPQGEGRPPTIQSPSIQMTAVNGINNAGKTVWWEEVLLQVVEKGRKPYTLPTPPDDACVLMTSVNQTLLQKGINVDQVSFYRRECNGPAARLVLLPAHNSCVHANPILQKPPGTRVGYVFLMPVNVPPPPPSEPRRAEEEEDCA